MITSPDQEFLIIGTGYLLDDSVKVYRYNDVLHQYVHVTDLGDGIIKGDVISLAWGDTDHNNFPEIIAGSADGYAYVFEQTHIYDPKTNLENNFELVWTSPRIEQVWGVALGDTDLDYQPDIITGSWDSTVRWYEYVDHSGYPFSVEHWINYKEKYVATIPNKDKVTSIATTDLNGNGLPDVIVGTWSGAVYIYENNGTVLTVEGGKKFPLAQDNSYRLIYSNTNQFWKPITRIVKGNLDADPQSELAFLIPGQGVFTFDFDVNSGKFFFNKLIKDVLPVPNYELGANAQKLNDWTVDFATNTYADFITYGYNVWGKMYNGTYVPEPFDNLFIYNPSVFPYNTNLAQRPNGNYTWFKPLGGGDNATAVIDFGFGQEVTGDGRLVDGTSYKGYDLQIIMNKTPNINQWDLSISPDNKTWLPIKKTDMANGGFHDSRWYLLADTDSALNLNKSLYYRYLKVVFWGPGNAFVDSVNSTTLARALTEATAVGIGHIDTSYFNFFISSASAEKDRLITGTADGKMFVHEYDAAAGQVKMVYDFFGGAAGDRFNLGTNIWDIVEVKNTGTLPTWFGINDLSLNTTLSFSPNQYYSHTYAHLNALELVAPNLFSRPNQDLIVTYTNGQTKLYYGGTTSQFDPFNLFAGVNAYYGGSGNMVSHGFGDTNGDNFTDLMVSASWNGVVADPLQDTTGTVASIRLWRSLKSGSVFTPFSGNIDLTALETTGSLKTALKYTQAKPGIALVDLDGDGDLDIVFTNGHVYAIWNIANYLVWQFDSSYFESINSNLAGNLYYSPVSIDIDMDTDMDLIFSYALTGDKPRYGGVWYRNDGYSAGKPVYSYQKRLFINPDPYSNLAFGNYTSFQFNIDFRTGKIMNMTAYNDKLNALIGLKADYTNHNNFMVATYPLLRRVEINLRESTLFKNFGYRIFETWNTETELNDFTQSIQFTDLDKDGKGEVVVGDYDNNMYIFEYLTSGLNGTVSTYKIAYKSPNLVQHQTLTESPYASDQLAGLTGNFTRTIWRNAKFVLGGLDLNNNGLQEVVVTAGLAFYVFELDEFGNDIYHLIYTSDLTTSIFTPILGKFTEFTALGGGIDSDFNGRGEILLAVGPALFMFEYAGEGQFNEIYQGYPILGGRYFSVGNPVFANYFDDYVYKNMIITSLAIGDVNRNNYMDIVVGGYYLQPYGRLDGSLTILENRLGTIVPVYEFPQKEMREAPINDIKLADQDFDQNIELLVATDKGVDIWEYNAVVNEEYNFVRIGQISSSMNHPIPKLNYLGAIYSQPDKTLLGKTQDILVIRTAITVNGLSETNKRLNPGDIIEVASIGGKLVMAYSRNDGKTWKFVLNSGSPFLVPGLPSGSSGIKFVEYDPSIIQLENGNIAIAYMTNLSYNFGSGTVTATVVSSLQLSATSGNFGSAFMVKLGADLGSPTIFNDPNSGSLDDGAYSIAYLNFTSHQIYVNKGQSASGVNPANTIVPKSIFGKSDYSDNATYLAERIDVTYYPLTDQYVMAFSGRIYNESKPDIDVFTSVSANNTLIPLYTSRVSSASTQDRFPSISVLQDEHSWGLVLVYEEEGIDPGKRIMASHSQDIGRSWTPPEAMNRLPDLVVNICFTQLGLGCFMFLVSDPSLVNQGSTALHPELDYADTFMYDIVKKTAEQKDYSKTAEINTQNMQFYWIASIVTERPAIAGRSTGGFAYSFSTTVYIGDLVSLLYRIVTAMSSLNTNTQTKTYSMKSENVAAVANDNLARNTIIIGKLETIAIGVNTNSEFAKFELGKALQIDTGDTDGDGRQEVIVASDRGVFLSELEHNYGLTRTYSPIWQKTDYGFGIHDVALGDANGDGFDEIYVSGEKGNVFAYGMANQDAKVTDFDFTYLSNNRQTEFNNQPAPDPYLYQDLIKTVDINGDGIKDIIYPSLHNNAALAQKIYAVDGKTNATLWTYGLNVLGQSVKDIELFDYNKDGKLDVVIGTSDATTTTIYVINSQNGALLYSKTPTMDPIKKILAGNFNAVGYFSFVMISSSNLYLFDPTTATLLTIDTLVSTQGYYFDMVSVNTKGNGLLQVLTVTSNGISKIYDIANSNFQILNDVPYGNFTSLSKTTDFYTSVTKYDIDADGLDEMFLAINSTVYAYDDTGVMLWNKTDLKMSRNLDKLTVVHSDELNKDLLLSVSYPKLLTFEDYSSPNGFIDRNYSSFGVNFGPSSWQYYNFTGTGTTFYVNATHSGDYIIYSYFQDNGYIEFNETQQYVSFYLTTQFNDSLRVIGLDQSNRTIYTSGFYNKGKNQLVTIALDKPELKRIIFEGKYGFSFQHYVIDDLRFGGTNIYALDTVSGKLEWHQEFLPTSTISFNPNVNMNNTILDNTVPLTYTIDPSFLPALQNHQGLASININTGLPEFMYTYGINTPTLSGVSLGEGLYAYLAYYPYTGSNNHYMLYTNTRINSTGFFSINYRVQNNALWQINTNKLFTNIVAGQLDSDVEQETIVYNNRLIAAIDNTGEFIWKFVTANDISQIMLVDLDNTGPDEVVVLLKDSTIMTLDAKFGFEVNSQTLFFFVPLKMRAVDFTGDGFLDIAIAETTPSDAFGALIGLQYSIIDKKFTLVKTSAPLPGSFKDFYLMDYDGDGKSTDFLLFFDQVLALLWYNFTLVNTPLASSSVTFVDVTVSDYDLNGITDFAFIATDNSITALYIINGSTFSFIGAQIVKSGLMTVPNQRVLYSIDLTRDGYPDVVQYQFGRGYALYDPLDPTLSVKAYWHERSFIANVMTSMDIDFDGYDELILRNERLVYAIRYDPFNTTNKDHFYTSWSSPLSNVHVLQVLPVKLLSSQTQLVYLNLLGQIFAVEGIGNPNTFVNQEVRFDYQTTKPNIKSIDSVQWQTSNWPDDAFTGNKPMNVYFGQGTVDTFVDLPENVSNVTISPLILLAISFISGLVTSVVLLKRNSVRKTKTQQTLKTEDASNNGGVHE